jgi:hypothetical protein
MVKTRSETEEEEKEAEGKLTEVMDRLKLLEEKVDKQGIEMRVAISHIYIKFETIMSKLAEVLHTREGKQIADEQSGVDDSNQRSSEKLQQHPSESLSRSQQPPVIPQVSVPF